MKRIILIVLTLYCTSAQSQTKSETEDWIIKKLNQYIQTTTRTTDLIMEKATALHKDYSFRFDQYYLVINYTVETTYYPKSVGEIKKNTRSCYEKIPIYDIESVSVSHNKLHISTNKNTVITWCDTYKNDQVSSASIVGFDGQAETDMSARMNKAFLHLKKFYKKPKSNEPF